MPVTTSYPGIYIEELPSSARTITAAPTSVTVFVGYTHPFKTEDPSKPKGSAERSLFGVPVRIFSFADYERMFGGLYASGVVDNSVPYAVQQFFLNGGADAYVVGLPTSGYGSVSLTIGSNLALKAREPNDAVDMTVTLSNIDAPNNHIADITIAYGNRTETYRGVSLTAPPDNAAHIDNKLARSSLVEVTRLVPADDSYGTFSLAANTPATFPTPLPTQKIFNATDFDDVFDADGALDKVDIFNLMAIPGIADNGVLTQAQAFCERKRAFLIMDAPDNYTADQLAQDPVQSINLIPKSANAALYFPYLQANDPLSGRTIPLAPSGYVAGLFARTDGNRGVWKAPAGLETTVKNTTGVVADGRMTDMQAGVLNNAAVNALRTFPGVGTVIFGARTIVAPNTAFQQWKYVPVRRMALFIEQTLYRNLGWVVFEPNDEPLWGAVRGSIERFMLSLFKQGAFQGSKPSEAFLVKCDSSTTTQDDIDNGRVNILVGFRPLKPAEFVVVQITQLAGQVQA